MSIGEICLVGATLYFLYKRTTYPKQIGAKVTVTGNESEAEKSDKLEQILKLFASSEIKHRRFAAMSISRLAGMGWDVSSSLSKLELAIADTDEEVRRLAIIAVGNLGIYSPTTIAQVSSFIKTENQHLRRAVMWTLVQFKFLDETIPYFLDGLSDSDADVRKLALSGLENRGGEIPQEAIKQLIQLLRDEDEYVVGVVIEILGEIGYLAKDAIPELFRLWNEKEDKLRRRISSALEKGLGAGAECFIPIFSKLLEMPEEKEGGTRRCTSSEVLASIGEKSVPALVQLLKIDESPLKITKRFGSGNIERYASSALKKIGQKSLLPLINELSAVQGSARERILYAIDHVGIWSESLREPLIQMFSAADHKIAGEAIKCFSKLAPTPLPQEFHARFKTALHSEAPEVREAAANALVQHYYNDSIEDFELLLSDQSSVVRAWGAAGLSKAKAKDKVSHLIPLLSDPEERVRISAINAIANLDENVATEQLVPFLQKDDGRSTSSALEALVRISSPKAASAVKAYNERTLIPKLIEKLENGASSYERERAALKLGELKAQAAVPSLVAALSAKESDLIETSIRSLRQISGAAELCGSKIVDLYHSTKNTGLRPELLELLGAWKYKAAIPLCVTALKHEWTELRNSAAFALCNFGDEAKLATSHLIENLNSDDYYEASIGTLISIGDPAVPALTQALKNRETIVKAAYVLSEIHSPFALDALVSHLNELKALINTANEKEIELLAYTMKRLGKHAESAIRQLNKEVKFKELGKYGTARVVIAEALLQLNDSFLNKEALFLLGQALCGSDELRRESALEKLEEIGTEEARKVIAENLVKKLILDLEAPLFFAHRLSDKYEIANQLRIINDDKGNLALSKFAEKNLPKLIADMDSGKNSRAFFEIPALQGISCLGKFSVKAIPALMKILESSDLDDRARSQVLSAVARTQDSEALKVVLPSMLEAFHKGDYFLAEDLVAVAPRNPQVIDALLSALDGEYLERHVVVQALSRCGNFIIPAIVNLAAQNTGYISANAAKVLLSIGESSLPHTIAALNDTSDLTTLLDTVFKIGFRKGIDLSPIESFIDDEAAIRKQVSAILMASSIIYNKKSGNDSLVNKLATIVRQAIHSQQPIVRANAYSAIRILPANEAIGLLISGLQDEDRSVKIAILTALSETREGSLQAVGELTKIISSGDLNLASYAAPAFRMIGTSQTTQALKELAEIRIPELVTKLSTGGEEERISAVREIVRIGDNRKEVIDILSDIVTKTYEDELVHLGREAIYAIVILRPESAIHILREISRSCQDSGLSELAIKMKDNIESSKVAAYLQRFISETARE